MNAPQWWFVVSGLFFGLGSLSFIVLIVLLVNLIQKQKLLVDRVNALVTKVDALVAKVSTVTDRVGDQAVGAAGNINAFTTAITQRAELVSVAFILLGALRGFLASKKASKNALIRK